MPSRGGQRRGHRGHGPGGRLPWRYRIRRFRRVRNIADTSKRSTGWATSRDRVRRSRSRSQIAADTRAWDVVDDSAQKHAFRRNGDACLQVRGDRPSALVDGRHGWRCKERTITTHALMMRFRTIPLHAGGRRFTSCDLHRRSWTRSWKRARSERGAAAPSEGQGHPALRSYAKRRAAGNLHVPYVCTPSPPTPTSARPAEPPRTQHPRFKATAIHVEPEIKRHGIRSDSEAPYV